MESINEIYGTPFSNIITAQHVTEKAARAVQTWPVFLAVHFKEVNKGSGLGLLA